MCNQAFRDLQAEFSGEVLLGQDVHSGQGRYLTLEDLKETSVHIVGAAGYGKSYYLRHLIDQLVVHRQAFGVIDPHSELYEYALWRLRRSAIRPDRIVLLDPGDTRYALGFNPLACGLSDPGETASMVLEAFLKAWGASSFDATPRLEGILRGMFRLLIAGRLTLLEGYDVLSAGNSALRRVLLEQVSDHFVRQDWDELELLAKREKLEVFESSRNRLRRVLQATAVQRMLAQTQSTLNLKTVLDEGKFLLANLGGITAPDTQRLIGALLVNGLFHAAKQRNSRRRRDWYLICDEFGEFATPDFANSLDQLRKFGVHLILAHQRLRQLEREDVEVMSAVMTNAKIKVVFGGLERSEADRMARELFTGHVRGDRVKHVAVQTKFRPVPDTFEVETESDTEMESDSETSGRSHGTSSGFGDTEGESWDDDDAGFLDEHGRILTHNRGRSEQSSSSASESSSQNRGRSRSSGRSRSIVPITSHEEFQEETGRQFWSLDEEWERLIGLVHRLDKRQALIKVYSGPVHHIVTPDIEPERRDERLKRFRTRLMKRCPYTKPVAAVTIEIEARRKQLTAMVEEADISDRDIGVRSFRE